MKRRSQVIIPFAHNNSLSFDGGSEYLRNITNNDIGIEEYWTLTFWIKFSEPPPSASRILNLKNGSNNQSQIDMYFNAADYSIYLVLYNSAGTVFKDYRWLGINNNFDLERWYHIAVVFEAGTLTLYRNGAAHTPSSTPTDNAGAMGSATRRIGVGAAISGASVSNFKMSSLFIYRLALTSAEVLTLYNGGSGNLVHPKIISRLNVVDPTNPLPPLAQAWLMGTGSAIATNLVSGGVDLTANMAAALTADDIITDAPTVTTFTFAHNHCLDFSGSVEYIRNTTDNTIGIANAWTIAMWLKPGETSFANNRTLFNVKNGANNNDRIDIRHAGNVANDPLVVETWDSGGTALKVYNWNNLINASSAWQHIVVTWDGTNLKLYSDGSVVAASSTATDNAGTMGTATRRLAFAANVSGSVLWSGRGHSVAVWARALSAADVTALYNGGGGSTYDIKKQMPINLKHWWMLGFTGLLARDNVDGDGADVRLNLALNATGISEVDDRIEDAP